jgi:hypothetical protein
MVSLDPFVSSVDLSALLGVTADPADLLTKMALDAACESVRSYLGQDVNYVANDVEYHSGRGWQHNRIRLRQRPVRSVASVQMFPYDTSPTTLVASDDYVVRDSFVIIISGSYWDEWAENIKVTYSHGWDVTGTITMPVPADIRLVALSAARRIYTAMGEVDDAGSMRQETMGTYSYTVGGREGATSVVELMSSEMAVLDRYRVGLVP